MHKTKKPLRQSNPNETPRRTRLNKPRRPTVYSPEKPVTIVMSVGGFETPILANRSLTMNDLSDTAKNENRHLLTDDLERNLCGITSRRSRQLPRSGGGLERGRPARLCA
jgi:hypothetical protein